MQGLDLYLTKGKAITCNSKSFNQLKLNLCEYELHFNERRCENFDMVGTYRPYHFNSEDFGLYLYAEMFGMYLLSILRQTSMTLREAHTLALDSVLTHVSFHYLIERYCILLDDVGKDSDGLYPAYKKKIYSQTWGTQECLEETLANAFVLTAHPHWTVRQKDYIQSLYARQREGYIQAHNLNTKHYRELYSILEEQLKAQRRENRKEASAGMPSKNTPSLYEFIHKNLPFRFIGLPVYLVNDCSKLEEFIHIVELLFPQI
ncbi:hypothetical protein [Desulfitobacterium sp. PCE1]|uniref:hypothetical protein n=1 Tax=Desulfitobacterium sp. PCE1 TaxID=146907 RepID=UPI000364299D|nr:hypothetical protein [Desulfitobacterium sp. PCE1]